MPVPGWTYDVQHKLPSVPLETERHFHKPLLSLFDLMITHPCIDFTSPMPQNKISEYIVDRGVQTHTVSVPCRYHLSRVLLYPVMH